MADSVLRVLVKDLELRRHPVGGPWAVGHGLEELAYVWGVGGWVG